MNVTSTATGPGISYRTWQQAYLARFYSRRRGWVDGTTEFHNLCRQWVRPDSRILEIGAGADNPTSKFLSTLGEVHGLDPDPAVRRNAALTDSRVLEGVRFPLEDAVFDACISNFVIEHIDDPMVHLREVARVLRPGGVYVFRTPNRFHYVALAASALPHSLHDRMANRLRNLPADAHAPHRTVYAMNSRRAIRRLAARVGMQVALLRMVEKEPSYGMSSPLLFVTFMVYKRLVNLTPFLAPLRSNIFGVLLN